MSNPRRKEWSAQEMAIVRATIKSRLTITDALEELHRYGYMRSLEGVSAKFQQERHRMASDPYADATDAALLRESISRRWVP